MEDNHRALFTAAQVRELDRRAIEDHGIGAYALMQRAGAAAWRLLRLRWPGARRLVVFCGGGNNGGDGLVLARLARDAGLDVRVALGRAPEKLKGAAADAWAEWARDGGQYVALDAFDPDVLNFGDVAVDALLGTGLDRPVHGPIAAAISRLNASEAPVLALDIPSGLHADTGAVLGEAVVADATLTFIGAKRGLYTGAAPDCAGHVFLDDLDVPPAIYRDISDVVRPVDGAWVRHHLPARRPTAHKGDNGHVLIVGGEYGLAGAARLAGETALRGGAGLVTVATRPEHATAMPAGRPDLMTHALADPEHDLPPLLERADVVAAGPGLGRGDWGRSALAVVFAGPDRPRVLDADALNLLAEAPFAPGRQTVLTPHPGEAARLLDMSTAAVQADRYQALAALVARYGATVVLKGPGTLVASAGDEVRIVPGARPMLAVGGMGDLLTGVIAALLGQGMAPRSAAAAGVWLHAAAADHCARRIGTAGVLPSDVMTALPAVRGNPEGIRAW